jgi:vacuolar iron transporter family protein
MNKRPQHFEGKDVASHLKEARTKGFLASRELHGTELSGFAASFTDTSKETMIVLSLVLIFLPQRLGIQHWAVFLLGYILWKVARSAFLGWSRIERLHRLIEEERWEIEHHRTQEKDELRAMYEAKGLKGKLLDETIEVLMADDSRLLQLMLQEELGLSLEVYEHPLLQAFGALLGSVFSGALFLLALLFFPPYACFIIAALLIGTVSFIYARKEKNAALPATVWSLSIASMSVLGAWLLGRLLYGS